MKDVFPRLKINFNNFKKYPKYPAYSLRPDAYFHPAETFKRKAYRSLIASSSIRIKKEKGFLIIKDYKSEKLDTFINHCVSFFEENISYLDVWQHSRPGLKTRLVIVLQYFSSSLTHQPLFERSIDNLNAKTNQNTKMEELKNLVLGYKHLAFPKTQGLMV